MAPPLRCDPALFERDLSGRTILVTGANSGLGLVTTRQLVKQGAHVVMACRRIDAGQSVADAIHRDHPRGRAEVMELDLGRLESVRRFAADFLASHHELHALVNNAGVMNTAQGQTADGFETQFGINHLGHFLLTSLLLDVLKASAPSRVVNISSGYHDRAMGREGRIEFEDLHQSRGKYDGWKAYAQSKLANVLHSRELARRLENSGVTAVSVHPGWVRTELIRHSMPVWVQNYVLRPAMRLAGMIEPWDGVQTTLHCLLDDDVPEHSGAYFSQRGSYRDPSCNGGGWPMRSPNPQANDDDIAARLWSVSEESVGLSE